MWFQALPPTIPRSGRRALEGRPRRALRRRDPNRWHLHMCSSGRVVRCMAALSSACDVSRDRRERTRPTTAAATIEIENGCLYSLQFMSGSEQHAWPLSIFRGVRNVDPSSFGSIPSESRFPYRGAGPWRIPPRRRPLAEPRRSWQQLPSACAWRWSSPVTGGPYATWKHCRASGYRGP